MSAGRILRRQERQDEQSLSCEVAALRLENARLRQSLMQTTERYKLLLSYIESLRHWIEIRSTPTRGKIRAGSNHSRSGDA